MKAAAGASLSLALLLSACGTERQVLDDPGVQPLAGSPPITARSAFEIIRYGSATEAQAYMESVETITVDEALDWFAAASCLRAASAQDGQYRQYPMILPPNDLPYTLVHSEAPIFTLARRFPNEAAESACLVLEASGNSYLMAQLLRSLPIRDLEHRIRERLFAKGGIVALYWSGGEGNDDPAVAQFFYREIEELYFADANGMWNVREFWRARGVELPEDMLAYIARVMSDRDSSLGK